MAGAHSCPTCGEDVSAVVADKCRARVLVPFEARPAPNAGAASATARVRVVCSQGHAAEYPCAPAAPGAPPARARSAEEETWWASWRAFADPLAGVARLETYARWILGANALVAALAAMATVAGAEALRTYQPRVYALAVAFLGFGMTCAATSLAPKWETLNPDDPESVRLAFGRQFAHRRRWLLGGAAGLALALVTAGLVPLAATFDRPTDAPVARGAVTYALAETGALSATIAASGLAPFTPVTVRVEPADSSRAIVYPSARGVADTAGAATVTLEVKDARALGAALRLVGEWREASGARADTATVVTAGIRRP